MPDPTAKLPREFLDSLTGIEGFEQQAFEAVHAGGEQVVSIRVNPSKISMVNGQWSMGNASVQLQRIPWTEYGYYLSERPSFTFDPLFHAGCYYVQEASSMFLEQALRQTTEVTQPLNVLDLSAAPGGKSTHLQSLLSNDSLLVSNEVIRSRANVLVENIIKWGCSNVAVTNNDPRDFKGMESFFDVIVVDAPCSGSGLFRREPAAIDEWSLDSVQLCSRRQQRILADVWPSLKKNGLLVYSTCSYSKEEDEGILDWIAGEFPVNGCRLELAVGWNIMEVKTGSGMYGYRFWPHKVKGEGFFIACCRKREETTEHIYKTKRIAAIDKKSMPVIEKWMEAAGYYFTKHLNTVYAWPEQLAGSMARLLDQLRVIYSGIRVGGLVRDKLIPDHALALSGKVNNKIPRIDLQPDQAIRFLQRKDLDIAPAQKGWQLVTFLGREMGWINVLANRINNYYPKGLRILKDN